MLLGSALEQGWVAMDLEHWIATGGVQGRVLILRHDVDQHPATAVTMARIDARHGVRGTWYFRWRTTSLPAIEAVRQLGGEIGFHYETLTRFALEQKLGPGDVGDELIARARSELSREISAFEDYVGPIRSICAHGDTRVPGVTNQVLVRGEDPSRFGVGFDANEALSRHRLGLWMTDRAANEGGWKDGIDPLAVLREATAPILCLTHPNNWCSGVSLWTDRLRAAVLPAAPIQPRRGLMGSRTRGDQPPGEPRHKPAQPRPPDPDQMVSAGPPSRARVGATLRREIARQRYDHGERLSSMAGQRLLDLGTGAFSASPAEIERVLSSAGLQVIEHRELLELGAGFGGIALLLACQGARVTALDPDPERLAVAARVAAEHSLALQCVIGAAADGSLGSERFDAAILSSDGLGSSRRETFANALTALRRGGVLIVRAPEDRRLVRVPSGGVRRGLRRAGFVDIRRIGAFVVAARPDG